MSYDLDVGLPDDEADVNAALREYRDAEEEARRSYEHAQSRLLAHDKEAQELSRNVAVAEENLNGLNRQITERREELENQVEAYGSDEALAESLQEAKQNESEIRDTVSEVETKLTELNAGEIDDVVARTERAYELARDWTVFLWSRRICRSGRNSPWRWLVVWPAGLSGLPPPVD